VYIVGKPGGQFMVLNTWDSGEQAAAWPQKPEHQQIVAELGLQTQWDIFAPFRHF